MTNVEIRMSKQARITKHEIIVRPSVIRRSFVILVSAFVLPSSFVYAAGPVNFLRHEIDDFPAGYQVAVADLAGRGRPDVIALSTDANRVDWYENPFAAPRADGDKTADGSKPASMHHAGAARGAVPVPVLSRWTRHPVAVTGRNIDLAPYDIDGDGRPEIALASGFYFDQSRRGGQIQWLGRPSEPGRLWQIHPIAVDPVVHRLRWGDLDGDGRAELVHAPIFGPGSHGAQDPRPAHLWAFSIPKDPLRGPWEPWKIDETLTVLHGLHVSDLDGDGRAEILTASFEGIHLFHFEGPRASGHWRKQRISAGAEPAATGTSPGAMGSLPGATGSLPASAAAAATPGLTSALAEKQPVAPAGSAPAGARGASEIVPGWLGPGRRFLASIEPWHGNQVVVYTRSAPNGPWQRHVLDASLYEGHALVAADLDGDGQDELVAGWRAGGGGLRLYKARDAAGQEWTSTDLDSHAAVEGLVVADVNGDGRPDLVAIAGRDNKLLWYENCKSPANK
jgi:hypothetical protein